jgi:hypothetical protein
VTARSNAKSTERDGQEHRARLQSLFKRVDDALARVVTRYVRSDGAQRRHCDGQEHRAPRLQSQFKRVDDALARVVTVSVTRYVRSEGALACCETAVITGRFAACDKRRESVRGYRSDCLRERLLLRNRL